MLKAACRSRNRAEWHRGRSNTRSRAPLEIDNDLNRIADNLEVEEKWILRTVQMGGNQALNDIADYNQDVGRMCSYCGEAVSTSEHIRWSCNHGIAPAMKADGKKTFWGADFSEDMDEQNEEVTGREQ